MSLPTTITDMTTQHESHHEVLHQILNAVLSPEVFDMARIQYGLLADRSSPGRQGSFWVATDSGALNITYDNGSAWIDLWDLMQTGEFDLTTGGNLAKLINPCAELGLSGNHSINAGTDETIGWNATAHDNSSFVSGSTFVIPKDGVYGVGAVLVWDSDCDGDSATNLFSRIILNNANYVVGDRRTSLASSHQTFYAEQEFSAGDDLRVKAQRPGVSSGATFVLGGSSKFYIKRISDV